MEVIFSSPVIKQFADYAAALSQYSISEDRLQQKIQNMRVALLKIGNAPFINPVCKFSDLGQSLDRNRNPKNPYLRQFVYKDEANKPWSFSYLVDERNDRVYITAMKYSAFVVKEDKDIQKILSLMERIDNLNK